ncbi:MAG: class II fumarate hydratase, partial [Desulfobacteraceae bacterium]|nr:class II fumarate hydratase [Desulfobacteraceae bacterium]
MTFRQEQDAMGTVEVPAEAYYGSQTARAVANFPVSGLVLPAALVRAMALVKVHAARANADLGLLDAKLAEAIVRVAREVVEGRLDDQFVVDVFQTGSGTSTHMNLNEVIAGRANEMLTGRRGGRAPVHPNDHVNIGQSSNDLVPTGIHVAARLAVENDLAPALAHLAEVLEKKEKAFAAVAKIGRTHLQDAVPITLGQEFSGYAAQVHIGIERVGAVLPRLEELALGGTAVGTGLNAHPAFAPAVIRALAAETGIGFVETRNHFQAQAAQDTAVELSGALKTVAVSLVKIANDLRWLASGPRCGLGEINLPSLQPGSSIMPGKVNPVIAEAVLQVAAQVVGNDATIAFAGAGGHFELNTMLPVIAYNLLQSVALTAAAARILADKCVAGITANKDVCAANIERSLALVTALVPRIGYDNGAVAAKEAFATGRN